MRCYLNLVLIAIFLQVYVAQDDDTIGKGAFKTVQEAYDNAKPNGRIKFTPGVYCESVTIR